jgi:hypothetical protein
MTFLILVEIMSDDKTVSTPPRLIPSTRFTLALLVSLALFIQYAQRVSLSMSIVCMVDKRNINALSTSPSYSTRFDNRTSAISTKYGSQFLKEKQFLWTELQQQILLGAYWFGYIFTLVPSNSKCVLYYCCFFCFKQVDGCQSNGVLNERLLLAFCPVLSLQWEYAAST